MYCMNKVSPLIEIFIVSMFATFSMLSTLPQLNIIFLNTVNILPVSQQQLKWIDLMLHA